MRILGIDPGTGRTGWGVIDVSEPSHSDSRYYLVGYGCLTTPKEEVMQQRLLLLHDSLVTVLDHYKPDCMALEQLFFGVNSRTAMSVGQARGVVMFTAARYKLELYEYQGLSVKRELTGDGRADKKMIQSTVQKLLSLPEVPKPDDAADALGIAICHAVRTGLVRPVAPR